MYDSDQISLVRTVNPFDVEKKIQMTFGKKKTRRMRRLCRSLILSSRFVTAVMGVSFYYPLTLKRSLI